MRYQSAAEMRADLKRLKRESDSSRTAAASAVAAAESGTVVAAPRRVARPRATARPWALIAGAVVALALVAAAYVVGRRMGDTPPPLYHLLTYRRGTIRMARFAPDGQTIVYSAAWEGKPSERLYYPRGQPGVALAGRGRVGDPGNLLHRRTRDLARQPADQEHGVQRHSGAHAAGWRSPAPGAGERALGGLVARRIVAGGGAQHRRQGSPGVSHRQDAV